MKCVGKLGAKKDDRCLSVLDRKDLKGIQRSVFTCPKCSVIVTLPFGHYLLIEEDAKTKHIYKD